MQQLTSEGNILSLVLNASPMGLIANTTWSCSRTRSINMLNRARGVPSVCLDFSRDLCVCVWVCVCVYTYITCTRITYLSICLILEQMSFFSSIGNILGTSPVLRRLPMSSKKFSSLICVSVNKNTAWEDPSAPLRRIFFKSSLHSTAV